MNALGRRSRENRSLDIDTQESQEFFCVSSEDTGWTGLIVHDIIVQRTPYVARRNAVTQRPHTGTVVTDLLNFDHQALKGKLASVDRDAKNKEPAINCRA